MLSVATRCPNVSSRLSGSVGRIRQMVAIRANLLHRGNHHSSELEEAHTSGDRPGSECMAQRVRRAMLEASGSNRGRPALASPNRLDEDQGRGLVERRDRGVGAHDHASVSRLGMCR
jgi:hypothetical protein